MVTRDFDAMLAQRAGVRPTFRVAGQTFTVKAKLPFRKFRALLTSLGEDNVDEEAKTQEFFTLALVRQDRGRFFALLNYDADEDEDGDWDEANIISPEQVNDLTQWLMELYTGKASENSDSSSNGSEATPVSQNVVSLNPRTQSA